MDNLSFDPVKVDTALAEEYIKNKDVIEVPIEPGTAWDYKSKEVTKDLTFTVLERPIPDLNQKLRNLSKKLQDNSELICQLEYLMRKTDVEETRNCHLKLVSQYLRLENRITKNADDDILVMEESTPLYYLGYVADMFHDESNPILICGKTTAPICQLFDELCSDVGLDISLYCVNKRDLETWPDRLNYSNLSRLALPTATMGCTLAITEEADVDSAVDVFLNSSENAPWRIERIYVQESVYDQLMEALEARCAREPSDRCVDAFRTARGRAVECGVSAGGGAGAVPVRAYRGARELLALLPPGAGGSLSLWCGAAAAAYELALAAPTPLVWIDHYAAFDGPPSASIPLYNRTVSSTNIPESDITQLLELQRTWTALSLDERKAVVLQVLKRCSEDGVEVSSLAQDIADWMPDAADVVDIAPDRITMVIHYLRTEPLYVRDNNMLEAVKLAILGYRIVIRTPNYRNVTTELSNSGVPVIIHNISKCTHKIKSKLFYTNKKVIHFRFGTIYSN